MKYIEFPLKYVLPCVHDACRNKERIPLLIMRFKLVVRLMFIYVSKIGNCKFQDFLNGVLLFTVHDRMDHISVSVCVCVCVQVPGRQCVSSVCFWVSTSRLRRISGSVCTSTTAVQTESKEAARERPPRPGHAWLSSTCNEVNKHTHTHTHKDG